MINVQSQLLISGYKPGCIAAQSMCLVWSQLCLSGTQVQWESCTWGAWPLVTPFLNAQSHSLPLSMWAVTSGEGGGVGMTPTEYGQDMAPGILGQGPGLALQALRHGAEAVLLTPLGCLSSSLYCQCQGGEET